jgi:hypothetical protein
LKKGLILDDTNVMTHLGCFSKEAGAGDVAILAAIYFASRYANNPILGIKIPALSFGVDTDTIASITGGLLGMLCGTNWIPIEWKLVQDYECLVQITDLLISDDHKIKLKSDVNAIEQKINKSSWINTIIGRIRKIDTKIEQSGKYATITITKWQSVLGQTIYIKEMRKLDAGIRFVQEGEQIPQQRKLKNEEQQSKEPEKYINFDFSNKIELKSMNLPLQSKNRRIILDEVGIENLLSNSDFKQSMTIGKTLKILKAVLDDSCESATIAKQYNVEQTIVELIKSLVIE